MATEALAAVKAYAAQAKSLGQAAGQTSGDGATGFGNLLDSAMQSAKSIGQEVDGGIRAQAAGKAELVDVVTAVAEAELTVQTIVSVRDRMIAAYQEIIRMPI